MNLNTNYYFFIFLSFSLGMMLASFFPINMATLTTNVSADSLVVVASLRRWMFNLGACISFSIIGYLTKSPHQLFFIVTIVFFLIGILELFKIFKLRSNAHETKDYIVNNFKNERNSKSMWIWIIGVFISYIVYFQIVSIYPIFLKDYSNINAGNFSQLMVISSIVVIGLQFIMPIVEKYLSVSVMSALGIFLIGVGLALVIIPSHEVIIISVVIWSIGEIFLLGITPIYAKLFAGGDPEKNLYYSAKYYAACYLGKLVGPICGGYFYNSFHWHKTLLCGFLILSTIAGFCFYCLRNVDYS